MPSQIGLIGVGLMGENLASLTSQALFACIFVTVTKFQISVTDKAALLALDSVQNHVLVATWWLHGAGLPHKQKKHANN